MNKEASISNTCCIGKLPTNMVLYDKAHSTAIPVRNGTLTT